MSASSPASRPRSSPSGARRCRKKLGRNRAFTFAQTFFGNKIDKIHGRFTSSNEVEGFAIYHFSAQDLCGTGKSRVNFTREAQVAASLAVADYATTVSAAGSTEKSSSVYSPM